MIVTTVELTQEHIDDGKKAHAWDCAIALAINAKLKPDYFCAVVGREVRFYQRDAKTIVTALRPAGHLPPSVVKWEEDFDFGKKMSPITFHLDIPEEALR